MLDAINGHDTFVARGRDWSAFVTDLLFGFSTKLLRTALPDWRVALVFSLVENWWEVFSLWRSFGKGMNEWEAAVKLAGSSGQGDAIQSSRAHADPLPERQRLLGLGKDTEDTVRAAEFQVGMLSVNYLTNMISEVAVSVIAVAAAVIFVPPTAVSGLSNEEWRKGNTAVKFLLANLLPELFFDVVGVGYLHRQGIDLQEIFSQVHGTWYSLGYKVAATLMILPLVAIAAKSPGGGG